MFFFSLVIYRLATSSHRALHLGDTGTTGTKKDLYITIVAFAVSLFCWFSVVVQSSGCWQKLRCISPCIADSSAHRSSHTKTNTHHHHRFCLLPLGSPSSVLRPASFGCLHLRGRCCISHAHTHTHVVQGFAWEVCELIWLGGSGLKASRSVTGASCRPVCCYCLPALLLC